MAIYYIEYRCAQPLLHDESKAFVKGEGFDVGDSMLEYVLAVGEKKESVIGEGELDPQAQGTSGEDEQTDSDSIAQTPLSILCQDVLHAIPDHPGGRPGGVSVHW